MEYALIRAGKVENVIVADAEFATQLASEWDRVEVINPPGVGVGVGWGWDGTQFVAPIQPEPEPAPAVRVLSKLDYMNRFADAELAGIYTAAKTVISVEVWLEKFKLASDINLDDPRTIGGLQAMEAAGLLAVGRAAEILS